MLTPTDSIIILCIIAALVALGTVIALSNERVRRATLQVRDVTREYALADLAMRRENARRSISYASPADALPSLTQIALDVSGKRYDLSQLSATKDTTAIVARTRDLYDLVFAPNDKAYFASHLSARSRKPVLYDVNGMTSGAFVAQELEAAAQAAGITTLPRVESWTLIILEPQDDAAAMRSGFRFRLPKFNLG